MRVIKDQQDNKTLTLDTRSTSLKVVAASCFSKHLYLFYSKNKLFRCLSKPPLPLARTDWCVLLSRVRWHRVNFVMIILVFIGSTFEETWGQVKLWNYACPPKSYSSGISFILSRESPLSIWTTFAFIYLVDVLATRSPDCAVEEDIHTLAHINRDVDTLLSW